MHTVTILSSAFKLKTLRSVLAFNTQCSWWSIMLIHSNRCSAHLHVRGLVLWSCDLGVKSGLLWAEPFLLRTFQCWQAVQHELSAQRVLGKSYSLPRRIVYSQSKTENNHVFVLLASGLLDYWTDSCFRLASLFKSQPSSSLLKPEILHIHLFSCCLELKAWTGCRRNTLPV